MWRGCNLAILLPKDVVLCLSGCINYKEELMKHVALLRGRYNGIYTSIEYLIHLENLRDFRGEPCSHSLFLPIINVLI